MHLSTASVHVGSPPANRLATARNTGVPTDRPVLPCTHRHTKKYRFRWVATCAGRESMAAPFRAL